MEAIVTELDQEIRKRLGEENLNEEKQEKNKQKTRVMLFLAVAYAASCGGVGTLTGYAEYNTIQSHHIVLHCTFN